MTEDDPARALIAPFTLPQDWNPTYGTCSRCGRDAVQTDTGWHHDGRGCDPRRAAAAEFIPDPE
ncbi:hypothetical protein [Streptacidiphilus sp. PAMC 29251]